MEIFMKNKKSISLLWLATLLISACGSSSAELTVQDAWARPAINGNNGAAYFIIENDTSSEDTLLSVTSDIASAVEVHMSMMDGNGVMSMQMQEAVTVPSGKTLEFKPGGLHVMLIRLNQDLKIGDTISLTLIFEKTGSRTIEVTVKEE
jgi:periplasmic copper chaperone A